MKRTIVLIALAFELCLAPQAFAAPKNSDSTPLKQLAPTAEQAEAAILTTDYLTRAHYRPMPLDDAMSLKIYNRYLKALDSERMIFTQSDINQFEFLKNKLDDAIVLRDLRGPFAIYNLYQKRVIERWNYARSLLKGGFDFNVDESMETDRENAAWPTSEAELNEIWRKRVKAEWLSIRLGGKDAKNIRETLDRRYERALKKAKLTKGEEVFQLFMDSYALSVDPHTNYLGPKENDGFKVSMSLSLIGIGASLTTKDDYTVIRELIVGGPAAMSKKFKPGDKIIAVGQGKIGPMVDVVGWRVDDVVKLIRGKENTIVRLDVIPESAGADGKHNQITLVRQKIKLEEQAAKKSIIKTMDGGVERSIGVIALPTFYQDSDAMMRGERDYRSATRDVQRLLIELKRDKVDAVLIDLRNNGGGSLTEAIDLTGLFIDKGPVVQQKNAEGDIRVSSDTRSGMAWDGPMGVLINRGSASASEIFAAAIQDYSRGIIIGETTFGKGTVQQLRPLGENPQLGAIKWTIAQFFRINGGTTQLRGVIPDIAFPLETENKYFGESSYDNALPWSMIKPADYKPVGDLKELLPILQAKEEKRLAANKDFKYLQEDWAELQKMRKEGKVSLNETVRRKEREERETKRKLREAGLTDAEKSKISKRKDDGLLPSERSIADELKAEQEFKDAKDILLEEAANIMGDEVGLLRSNTKLADRVLPRPSNSWFPFK
jgi:carboxyl-terminal processing protease